MFLWIQYWYRKLHSQMLFETLQEGESAQDLTGVIRRIGNLCWNLSQKEPWFSNLWYVTVMLQPCLKSSRRSTSSLILPHCAGKSLSSCAPGFNTQVVMLLEGELRFTRLPHGWGYFQQISSSQWACRSPEALSLKALGDSNYTLIRRDASAEQRQDWELYFKMPAVLKPSPFLSELSKWMLTMPTAYTCIQLSKILGLKLHIVDPCNLYLNQKESLRLHSPTVWLKSSLDRNETEGVQVLAVEKVFS